MYGWLFLMMAAGGIPDHAKAQHQDGIACRAAAPARPVANMTIEQACALVEELVRNGVADRRAQRVSIELDLSRAGSAIAHVQTGSIVREVAVDVMDRPLRRIDFERLGSAIVDVLKTDLRSLG